MIGGICESPMTITALLAWRDAINEGRILLRDVIDLEATQGGAPGEGKGAMATNPGAVPAIPRPPMPKLVRPAPPPAVNGNANGEAGAEASTEGGEDDDENALSLSALEEKLKPEVLRTLTRIAKVYVEMSKVQNRRLSTLKPRPEAQPGVREELREAPQEDRRAGAHGAHQRQPHRAAQARALRPQPQADDARRQAAAAGRGLPHPAPGLPRQLPDPRDRPELARQGRQAVGQGLEGLRQEEGARRREDARGDQASSPTTPARRSSSSAAWSRPCRTASAR